MRLAFGAILTAALVCPALADDAQYRKCVKQSVGTNVALNQCGDGLLKRADEALNAAWKEAEVAMPGEASKKALLEEQRAWNAYKEKSCLIYADGDFGREGQVINYPTCRADVIEARTKYLKLLVDN